MNIATIAAVAVSLFIAVVILVPIGFVFGGLWGVLLAVFILLSMLVGLHMAEKKAVKAAKLRKQIAAGKGALARKRPEVKS